MSDKQRCQPGDVGPRGSNGSMGQPGISGVVGPTGPSVYGLSYHAPYVTCFPPLHLATSVPSVSPTSGTLVVKGGMGVSGAVNILGKATFLNGDISGKSMTTSGSIIADGLVTAGTLATATILQADGEIDSISAHALTDINASGEIHGDSLISNGNILVPGTVTTSGVNITTNLVATAGNVSGGTLFAENFNVFSDVSGNTFNARAYFLLHNSITPVFKNIVCNNYINQCEIILFGNVFHDPVLMSFKVFITSRIAWFSIKWTARVYLNMGPIVQKTTGIAHINFLAPELFFHRGAWFPAEPICTGTTIGIYDDYSKIIQGSADIHPSVNPLDRVIRVSFSDASLTTLPLPPIPVITFVTDLTYQILEVPPV